MCKLKFVQIVKLLSKSGNPLRNTAHLHIWNLVDQLRKKTDPKSR